MRVTRMLWAQRQPMIKFVGRRHSPPAKLDHAPAAHPASPSHELPESFANYRSRVQSHGPLGGQQPKSSSSSNTPSNAPPSSSAAAQTSSPYGAIGGHSARELGAITLGKGEVWDRNELPQRFHRKQFTAAEIEAIESGGASLF